MVVNVTKTSQNKKNKNLLNIKKNQDEKKRFDVITKNYFSIENFASL